MLGFSYLQSGLMLSFCINTDELSNSNTLQLNLANLTWPRQWKMRTEKGLLNCTTLNHYLATLTALVLIITPTISPFSFYFFYSCCSHVEHRASVKRFDSLQFINLRQSAGLFGRGISPSLGRYLIQTQNEHRHPCVEWDSNPPSQCSNGRTHFMP
jgi:hypothetical protein